MTAGAARDPRHEAPIIGLDLARSTQRIQQDLRERWPEEIHLWWELETDERSGWVYRADNRILAKLVHVGGLTR